MFIYLPPFFLFLTWTQSLLINALLFYAILSRTVTFLIISSLYHSNLLTTIFSSYFTYWIGYLRTDPLLLFLSLVHVLFFHANLCIVTRIFNHLLLLLYILVTVLSHSFLSSPFLHTFTDTIFFTCLCGILSRWSIMPSNLRSSQTSYFDSSVNTSLFLP